MLAGFPQGVAELLVLGDRLGQLALGLEQPLLEGADPLRGVGEPSPQVGDLVAQGVDLGAQRPGAVVAWIGTRRSFRSVVKWTLHG